MLISKRWMNFRVSAATQFLHKNLSCTTPHKNVVFPHENFLLFYMWLGFPLDGIFLIYFFFLFFHFNGLHTLLWYTSFPDNNWEETGLGFKSIVSYIQSRDRFFFWTQTHTFLLTSTAMNKSWEPKLDRKSILTTSFYEWMKPSTGPKIFTDGRCAYYEYVYIATHKYIGRE